jgi:[ribosomal protein S18]-alanine N-acetyltransferase
MKKPKRSMVRKGDIRLRYAGLDDLRFLVEIDYESDIPRWSASLFQEELNNSNSATYIAEYDGEPVAYLVIQAVLREVHILKVAVLRRFRQRGIAKALMTRAIEECIAREMEVLFLEVRVSNIPAIALYQGLGFKETGRRKGYYTNTGEDAILMELNLLEKAA